MFYLNANNAFAGLVFVRSFNPKGIRDNNHINKKTAYAFYVLKWNTDPGIEIDQVCLVIFHCFDLKEALETIHEP